MIGIKNEYGEIHYVNDFSTWKKISNRETNSTNARSYYFPRAEYLLQVTNFLLATTLFEVLERLGRLSIFPAIIAFFINMLRSE